MSLSKFARDLAQGVKRSGVIAPSLKTLITPNSTVLRQAPKLTLTRLNSSSQTVSAFQKAQTAAAANAATTAATVGTRISSLGPNIVSDVDAWANDANQTIIPKFNTGEPGWNYEDIVVDCSGMDLRKYLLESTRGGTQVEQRLDDGSERTDSAPGVGSSGGGSGSAGGGQVNDAGAEENVKTGGFQMDKGEIKHEVAKDIFFDADHPGLQPLIAQMNETFEKHGVIYLRNTGLTDGAEMKALMFLAECTGGSSMKYNGGANYRGVNESHPNVYETGAPPDAHIHYHHEMAYVKESMSWIGFCCINGTPDPMKGATYISNQEKVTDDLMSTDFGKKLAEKGVCYVRKLPDRKYFQDNNLDTSIVYNYWQTSFLTEDPDEAVANAKKLGLDCEWQDSPVFGRYLVTKFYVDNYEYFPLIDKNVCYASVADDYMWFDKWKGVKDLPHHERPLKLNFGDDSIMTKEEKQQFVDAYDRHGLAVPWKQGDVAILCNYRTAHGRPAFQLDQGEKRDLGVVLGKTYKRVGQRNDKW